MTDREMLQEYRRALLKVWERAHKVRVGCKSESFDIAIEEARQLMIKDDLIQDVRHGSNDLGVKLCGALLEREAAATQLRRVKGPAK